MPFIRSMSVPRPGRSSCSQRKNFSGSTGSAFDQRETRDMVVMLVTVVRFEKVGLDLENAVEIEGIAIEKAGDVEIAALRPQDAGRRVDAADAILHGLQPFGRYEIGLVEDDRVGEGQLLLRFMCAVDLAEKVPGIDDGDDGVEPCLGADILVDEESLGDRRGGRRGPSSLSGCRRTLAPAHQRLDDADQVPAHRAADASHCSFRTPPRRHRR